MVLRIKRRVRWFFAMLDSEVVGPLQAVFYVSFILGAVYLLWFTDVPIEGVEKALGRELSALWAVLLMFGPGIWLCGMAARGSLAYHGMWGRLIGDITTGGAVAVYIISIVANTPWGKGVFSPFIAAPTAICILLLAIRDARRIIQVEQRMRR